MVSSKTAFADKLLPDQPLHTDLYNGDSGALWQGLYDVIARSSGLSTPYQDFDLALTDRFTVEEMASNPVSLRFLQLLIHLSGARRVLEIGAFIGVSAMTMARALPKGGEVTTIEKFDHFAAICRDNFARNGLSSRIRLLEGDAGTVIDGLLADQPFDLIFIDGAKERYAEYFDRLEPLLNPGGLFVVDDVFFHGDALNDPPRTEKGAGVRAFLDRAEQATGYHRILLPVANGMMLMMKPREALVEDGQ